MDLRLVRRLVAAGVSIGAAYAVTRQCRKPAGWMGRRVARMMNLTHAGVTAWGLRHVTIEPHWRVLDVGCGGGQTVRTLAAMASDGHVDGVDYAGASVAMSRDTNHDLIQSGRVDIQEAAVSRLPFRDESFDLVTAAETHYYWPHLLSDLREIRRVLKPGGTLVIIAETYKGRRMDWLFRPVMRILLRATYLSLDEHRALLTDAGFTHVEIDADPLRGWMCAIGARPT